MKCLWFFYYINTESVHLDESFQGGEIVTVSNRWSIKIFFETNWYGSSARRY